MSQRPRKRFGQNFLHDSRVIDRIVACVAPRSSDLLVEIGPGKAALTRPLIASGAELHVIEIDRDLVMHLQRLFAEEARVTVHAGDALQVDFTTLAGGRAFRLVGNLPYNISTPLLFHVLKWHRQLIDMHFMLQREVVERMAATPGSRAYGRLSVMLQHRCDVIPLFDVRPESFTPAPAVHSSVVRLQPLAEPRVDTGDVGNLERVVTAAFSQRRKTLRNSLRPLFSAAQIEAAGVDPAARAEQLDLLQFAALARALS